MNRGNGHGFSRRRFLAAGVLAASGLALPETFRAQNAVPMPSVTPTAPDQDGKADVTLRIGAVLVDVAQGKTLSTVGYNGQVPGPLIRLQEGQPVSMHVVNDTDTPEFVHWHGQFVPSEVDGAGEEKSLVVPPRGEVRYQFTPRPAGFRWVHTHVMAGSDLYRGLYGFLKANGLWAVFAQSWIERWMLDMAAHELDRHELAQAMREKFEREWSRENDR